MQTWKKLLIAFLLIIYIGGIAVIVIDGIGSKKAEKKNLKTGNIKLIEKKVINGRSIDVIEIYQHMYIRNVDGGIIHAEHCSCKNK